MFARAALEIKPASAARAPQAKGITRPSSTSVTERWLTRPSLAVLMHLGLGPLWELRG